jgi:cobalamin biosynthesis Mg chelatase CobN
VEFVNSLDIKKQLVKKYGAATQTPSASQTAPASQTSGTAVQIGPASQTSSASQTGTVSQTGIASQVATASRTGHASQTGTATKTSTASKYVKPPNWLVIELCFGYNFIWLCPLFCIYFRLPICMCLYRCLENNIDYAVILCDSA